VHTLLEPFQYAFFRNGLMVATLAGAVCGLIGTYVVLRSMSYIGHGLSHAIFGGFAASSLLGVNVFIGAGLWGVLSARAIAAVTRRRALGSDAVIGVITTASFAMGLVLSDVFHGPRKNFDAALFGSILGVGTSDVLAVAGAGLFAAVVVFLGYRRLLYVTFDAEVAGTSGVNVARWDGLLMLVLSIVILVTMKVLGVTLVAAVLVIPPTIARLLTNRFAVMLWLSTGIGAVCGFAGMLLSYHLDFKSGPTITLVAAAVFLLVFASTGPRRLRRLGHAHV
jgi:manganese/iron transport system permease protein/iron/zinc/copper transport system permease protein